MNELVEFFRGEGAAMGRDGDAMLWTTEQTAIHYLREHLRCSPRAPVPMILTCPSCGERHIDEGEFATKVHHTHACQHCGLPWRPALVPTVGVQFLPGFKNAASVGRNPEGEDREDGLRAQHEHAVPSDGSADAQGPSHD